MPETEANIEWVAIGQLFCSPTNPRHNDAAVAQVAASIQRFGWQQAIEKVEIPTFERSL